MAAQEHPNDLTMCSRCFAMVPKAAEFCPECGAPMAGSDEGFGSDAQVYPDLARANLLRIRGEYKQAADACLSILKKFPHNATAHTLMGDISAEQGDLEHAAEWYEMALDLIPDSKADQEKLGYVKQRISEKEAAATAIQLGLPTTRPRVGVFIAVALVLITSVSAIAFLFGKKLGSGTMGQPRTIEAPVVINEPKQTLPDATGMTPTVPPKVTENIRTPTPSRAEDDRVLIENLSKSLPDGAKVVEALRDPRTKTVLVTFELKPGEDPRLFGARIGTGVLGLFGDAPTVTVRAKQDNAIVYVADISRDRVMETATAEWQRQNKENQQAWLDAVLSHEWFRSREDRLGNPPPGGTDPNMGADGSGTTDSRAGSGN